VLLLADKTILLVHYRHFSDDSTVFSIAGALCSDYLLDLQCKDSIILESDDDNFNLRTSHEDETNEPNRVSESDLYRY